MEFLVFGVIFCGIAFIGFLALNTAIKKLKN